MKKGLGILVVALAVLSISASAFAFGLPKLPSAPAAASNSGPAADPGTFVAKAQETDDLVNKSSAALFNLISSKEEQAKAEELQKKLAATTDAKEKEAILKEKRASEESALTSKENQDRLAIEAKTWGDEKKKQAKNALWNIGLAGLIAPSLVSEGQEIASSLKSNPMNAPKALPVVAAINNLKNIATGSAKVMSSLPKVFGAANIKVDLPTSAAEKPADLGDIQG